ncbi:MAG: Uma2 family endonuclease [Synechocystis sp.]
MTALQTRPLEKTLKIRWEKLPDDFILPDEPVDSNLQPLLAAALREALELAGLILEASLIATNFGICATVDDKTVVKAPDWVYIPRVDPLKDGVIRRSYTPHTEGDRPLVVMEFISETEGGEYSINPYYPYGKWYFYEQILRVPIYAIFHPKTACLDVYRLIDGKYQHQKLGADGRLWLEEMALFLGVWQGKKAEMTTNWLRWWDRDGNLLLWGQESLDLERQRLAAEKQKLAAEKEKTEQAKLQAEQETQRAEQEKLRAEQETQRAEQEKLRAEQETQRAETLAQKLRDLGVDPENL